MNLTDEQVIKALEIHGNMKFDNCEGCPYLEGDSCEGFTKYSQPFREVLDLINRKDKVNKLSAKEIVDLKIKVEQQKADIDFYKERANKYEAQVEVLKEQTQKQKAEIERLREENKSIRYCYEQAKSYNNTLAESCEKNCKKFNMTTRAEAIKEFAERLKEKSQRYPYYKYGLIKAVPIDDIDNFAKEMVGDNNG